MHSASYLIKSLDREIVNSKLHTHVLKCKKRKVQELERKIKVFSSITIYLSIIRRIRTPSPHQSHQSAKMGTSFLSLKVKRKLRIPLKTSLILSRKTYKRLNIVKIFLMNQKVSKKKFLKLS